MKSVLLTTTAIVAFAGAAAADGHTNISTTLSATLGYNDTINDFDDNEIGFYWEGNLQTSATATLDNGITAGAYFEFEVAEDNDLTSDDGGIDLGSSDFVLSLEAENGGLFFGDTGHAADQHFRAAGDMESDGFTTATDSAVIRGDVSYSTDTAFVDASLSYIVNDSFDDDNLNPDDALEQLSVGAVGEFGNFFATFGYQEDTDFVDASGDFVADEIFAISAGGTIANATVTVAYADNSDADSESYGVEVSYPFGPVTATGYYVEEEGTDLPDEDPNFGITVAYSEGPFAVTLDFDDDQGTTKTGIDGSYDLGNGLELFAGYYAQDNEDNTDYEDEFYVAGEFDLGGGASILVSYSEGEDNEDDEIGANDYQEGTTVELTLEF